MAPALYKSLKPSRQTAACNCASNIFIRDVQEFARCLAEMSRVEAELVLGRMPTGEQRARVRAPATLPDGAIEEARKRIANGLSAQNLLQISMCDIERNFVRYRTVTYVRVTMHMRFPMPSGALWASDHPYANRANQP